MDSRYVIDVEKKVVFTQFDGRLTVSAIAEFASRLSQDPDFHPDYSELVDLRGVSDSDIDTSDFLNFKELDPFSPTAKRAFVTGNDLVYGTVRACQMIRDDANIQIFAEIDEARRWLALDSGGTALTHP